MGQAIRTKVLERARSAGERVALEAQLDEVRSVMRSLKRGQSASGGE